MPIRISQLRVETLRQKANPQMRVTQLAIEFAAGKTAAAQAKMRVTQIAIEFPFPSSGGGGHTPPPTDGDTPPAMCIPAPTQQCPIQPDLQALPEVCELQGS